MRKGCTFSPGPQVSAVSARVPLGQDNLLLTVNLVQTLPDLMTSQSVQREGHKEASWSHPEEDSPHSFSPSGMVNEWQLDCWKALKILLMNWLKQGGLRPRVR